MTAERRVALVIGNAAYAPPADLRNPVNDAEDMAQTLRGAGFDVLVRTNATQRQMQQALREFAGTLAPGGVGLFYFAGHGVQVKGRNFLVPIGATITSEAEVEDEAIDVNSVLARMSEVGSRVNIVVLDACRDNPFARNLRTAARGLASIGDAPSGTLIAYATGPGRVAADGTGRNGVYTGELVKAMREPGLTLEAVFKRAIRGVRHATREQQVPWFLSSVDGDFVFTSPSPGAPLAMAVPPGPARPHGREEIREFGTLALSATLGGIEVSVGDQKVWTSRVGPAFVLSNMRSGSHRIVGKKQGYRDWTRDVFVAAGQRIEFVIDIEPLRGELPNTVRGDDGAEMVLVPAGEFWMGSEQIVVDEFVKACKNACPWYINCDCKNLGQRELPRHRVHLDAFYIDRYEVTNDAFTRFVDASRHRTREPRPSVRPAANQFPAVYVTWHDAAAYCAWAGKRLPSEAEWEKAARGTDGRLYPWGRLVAEYENDSGRNRAGSIYPWGDADTGKANWTLALKEVGSHPAGVSPYGAHDMAGNAAEWVADWFDPAYYQQSPERNPKGPLSGQARVVRGGGWLIEHRDLRSAARLRISPDVRHEVIGFRCAKAAND